MTTENPTQPQTQSEPQSPALRSGDLLGAECRGCGLPLRGRPYCYGGSAYHPRTGERAKINYYGGFVCSRSCDHRASLELEQTMPGHGYQQTRLGCFSSESLARNWD